MDFLEDVILPPGEKLKRIRIYLDVTQHEVADGKISRNLLSYIEQGKTKLTKDTAKIVAESLNKLAELKHKPIRVTVEGLMQSETEQVEGLLARHLENLKQCFHQEIDKFEDELNQIKEIFKDWDVVGKKAEIFELAGDYYYQKSQSNESYIYYLISLENYLRIPNNTKVAQLYSKLGRCAIERGNYSEAINLNNQSLLIMQANHIQDKALQLRLLFNSALAYKKIKNYNKSLEFLEKLEEIYDNLTIEQRIDMSIVKANCFVEQGQQQTALTIYQELMRLPDVVNNLVIKSLILFNLGEIYHSNQDIEKAVDYLNECISIRLQINSASLAQSYYTLGKRFLEWSKLDFAENALIKGLYKAKEIKNQILQTEIYDALLDCYINGRKDIYIQQLMQELGAILERKEEMIKLEKIKTIYLKAVRYFIEKESEKSKDLLDFILSKS